MKPPAEGGDGRAETEALARYRAASRRRRSVTGTPDRRRTVRKGQVATPSGPRPDRRDPQRVGDVWRSLADDRGWTNEAALWSLTNRWSAMVGPQVAQHVAVVGFDPDDIGGSTSGEPGQAAPAADPEQAALIPTPGPAPESSPPSSGGKLTLRADSSAWQQQMIWNLPHLQRRLDTELGAGVVGRIVVLGPELLRRSYGSRRVKG